MEKDFLKLKTDSQKMVWVILGAGILLSLCLAVGAVQKTGLSNGYELERNKVGEGIYEQELTAKIQGEEKVSLSVTVEEQILSEAEAEQVFDQAENLLEDILLGENESFDNITDQMCLVESLEGIPIEIVWAKNHTEYFDSDGRIKEELELLEPVELKLSAVLWCQEYTRDYEKNVILMPRKQSLENQLQKLIRQNEKHTGQREFLLLPAEYEGKEILWKKPLDLTFLYVFFLTVATLIFLKFGQKRDEHKRKMERQDALEKDYAQMVSKFSMLLSAGLSVRNSWERIVFMERRKTGEAGVFLEEMNWALKEMQKGIPELEVYEAFGQRIGLVHYKKLMAMFVSQKKRGSGNLLEAMNEEMLQAWEEKKRKTRQQGEKISTKLLLPMMGMLLVVFVMILVPAFMSFQM